MAHNIFWDQLPQVVYDGLSEEMLPMDVTLQGLSGVKSVRYFLDACACVM